MHTSRTDETGVRNEFGDDVIDDTAVAHKDVRASGRRSDSCNDPSGFRNCCERTILFLLIRKEEGLCDMTDNVSM